MAIKIKWNSLLRLTELEFTPAPPNVLTITDELLQSISWLTAATKHDRKLLRCDENGALLITDAWNGFSSVEVRELTPEQNNPSTFTPSVEHKGILIATGEDIIKASFKRVGTSVYEHTYIPAHSFYWYAHFCIDIIITSVPVDNSTPSYVGAVAFN